MPLQLILIRHAETVANIQGRWVGWNDTPLTERGAAHAEAVARRLAAEVTDAVALYTSPLPRARRTAEVIGQALGLEPVPLDGLREINFGDMDGVTLEEIKTRYPDLYERWQDRTDMEFTWPGGERRSDFFRRVSATCDDILFRHQQGTVLIVAHRGTLGVILAYLLPEQMNQWWDYELTHCALTRVLVQNGRASLLALNDATHLSFP
ncbi:MAG: histidine phosphatase family protein [Anaerolineae bacterium]